MIKLIYCINCCYANGGKTLEHGENCDCRLALLFGSKKVRNRTVSCAIKV